ncbi:acyltransferase 3 [Paenibacillus curdlanolyticus YK9]|uniref:Acyltransferase 3 n=1 Tax=Paenibacillus curdlanolyticus YK9 TaxID=717606 RepID=E0I7C2_9BACL|nr:acyltransferase [Paenibacillus curdlanolyticus]EFM11938.1 acyltransferase 3 [Paenibacillus curdlanolyticus YK9]
MNKNHSIHGLRGMCALMVFVGHVISMSITGGYLTINEYPTRTLAEIGVDIFFIISGYLIVQSLVKHGNVKKFVINRFIRIYPVFIPLLMVMFIAGPLIGFEWLGELNPTQYVFAFLASLFMLPGVFPLEEVVRNSRTLSFEFAFYLVSAIFFVSRKNAGRKAMHYFLLLLGLAICIAVCYRYPRALFFLSGTIVYFISDKLKSMNLDIKIAKYYSIIALVGIYFCAYYHQVYLGVVLGVCFFAMMAREYGLLTDFLNTRVMQFYGTISYSFYLLHPFGLFPFQKVMGKLPLPDYASVAVTYVGGLLLATILGYFSYTIIEVKLTNRLFKKKRKAPVLDQASAAV